MKARLFFILMGLCPLAWADSLDLAAAETEAAESGETLEAEEADEAESDLAEPATPEDNHLGELRQDLMRLSLERDRLLAENSIARAQLEKELSARRADLERERLVLEEQRQKDEVRTREERRKLEGELNGLRRDSERLQLENTILKARSEIESTRIKLQDSDARSRIAILEAQIQRHEVEAAAANYTDARPVYLENPLDGQTLVISDRRIGLNGPITTASADFVSNRINYFNNKDSKHPVFIVIDSSPGGSVMAGYHILKSMESSQAPIYVVVKSFAASMAACIATCADRSFCYPNAVILHHQISGGTFGNLTQHRENLKEIEEWWRRLSGPVARKMGLSIDQFVERMYQEVSTGDWTEFGDRAAELKWIDHVVCEVRETALLKNPDVSKEAPHSPNPEPSPRPGFGDTRDAAALAEQTDEKGARFVSVPRLVAKDFYYLYNPDGYYRMP